MATRLLRRLIPETLTPQQAARLRWLELLERQAVLPIKWLMLVLATILLFMQLYRFPLGLGLLSTLIVCFLANAGLTWLLIVRRPQPRYLSLVLLVSLAVDTVFVAALVAQTGGLESVFYFFFFLLILRVGALYQEPRRAFVADLAIALMWLLAVLIADASLSHEQLILRMTVLWGVVLLSWFLIKMIAAHQGQMVLINETLGRQTELHSLLLAGMQDGVLVTDDDGRVELANPIAEEFLSVAGGSYRRPPTTAHARAPQLELPSLWMSRAELEALWQPSRSWWWRLPLELAAPQLEECLNEARMGRQIKQRAVTLDAGTDLERSVIVSIRPLEPGKKRRRWLLLLRDVSAYRTLENMLLQSEKLSVAGRLAAGLAHELGNPLGIIKSCAGYLTEKTRENTEMAEDLEIIASEAQRCQQILRQLFDLSSQEHIRIAQLDVSETVARAAHMVQYQSKQEHRIQVDLPPEPVMIQSDGDLITQALVNLLLNALQALDQVGEVRVELIPGFKDGRVAIAVSDTGRGIPEDRLDRIFEPFYTTRREGSGLGLAITWRVVERLGGRLEVESEVGRGSTFTLLLPVKSQSIGGRHER